MGRCCWGGEVQADPRPGDRPPLPPESHPLPPRGEAHGGHGYSGFLDQGPEPGTPLVARRNGVHEMEQDDQAVVEGA